MNLDQFKELRANVKLEGSEICGLMEKLYPICRSITGNGVRQTLSEIKNHIGLQIHEIPTNTQVFDWTIPKEWNITDAYIADSKGTKIVAFKKSNLHVVSYGIPVRKKMRLAELKQHIYTIPNLPDAIPYLTSYYKEDWGFCTSHNDFLNLKDEEYEVGRPTQLEGQFYDFSIRSGSRITYLNAILESNTIS